MKKVSSKHPETEAAYLVQSIERSLQDNSFLEVEMVLFDALFELNGDDLKRLVGIVVKESLRERNFTNLAISTVLSQLNKWRIDEAQKVLPDHNWVVALLTSKRELIEVLANLDTEDPNSTGGNRLNAEFLTSKSAGSLKDNTIHL